MRCKSLAASFLYGDPFGDCNLNFFIHCDLFIDNTISYINEEKSKKEIRCQSIL